MKHFPRNAELPALKRGSGQLNVLLLMTDEQRFDALGCAGNPLIRTPNLDRLAAQGMLFTQACAPTPICIPSRMSLITGQRAAKHHWVANWPLEGPLPELPTFMEAMLGAGYVTHGVGKMHFVGRHFGLHKLERQEEVPNCRLDDDYLLYLKEHGVRTRYPQGLRHLLYFQPQTSGIPREHSMSTWVGKRAAHFIHQHARYRRESPFFLWASWIAPHPPFAPCEPFDTAYDPDEMPLPAFPERPLESLPQQTWEHRARLDGAHLDDARMRRIRALYYGQVTHVDEEIGRVLQALEDEGYGDNTVVLFVSDHGDMLGDHGLSQKHVPYEGSIRVPMILRWPGRTTPGARNDQLVGLTDVAPTLLEELNLQMPDTFGPLPGANLVGRPGGGLREDRDAYTCDFGYDEQRWIARRTRTHKYVAWAESGMDELYDLVADPQERVNLVQDQPQLAKEMREAALEWERTEGLARSFRKGTFVSYPRHPVPKETPPLITFLEALWPEQLPEDEQDGVESFAESFNRAISKETTLAPDKLSMGVYKAGGGRPLTGTAWEDAWNATPAPEPEAD